MKIDNLSRFDELLAALNESFVLISVMKTQFKKMFLKKTTKKHIHQDFFFLPPQMFWLFPNHQMFFKFSFQQNFYYFRRCNCFHFKNLQDGFSHFKTAFDSLRLPKCFFFPVRFCNFIHPVFHRLSFIPFILNNKESYS